MAYVISSMQLDASQCGLSLLPRGRRPGRAGFRTAPGRGCGRRHSPV